MRPLTAASLGGIPIQLDPNARDYASTLAQAIEHVSRLIPEWTDFDPADPGVGILEAMAMIADVFHYNVDRADNEGFLSTAQRRSSVVDLLRLIGYELAPRASASVDLTVVTDAADVVIPQYEQFPSLSSPNTPAQVFELPESVTLNVAGTHTITVVHGTTIQGESLGLSSGRARQRFTLAKSPLTVYADNPPIGVAVGGVPWAAADGGTGRSFLGADPDDQVYTWQVDEAGVGSILFGDGVNGAIPAVGSLITATYRIGGGAVGNSVGKNKLTKAPQIDGIVSVTNEAQPGGGTDAESIDHARTFGPLSLRAGDRAVTLEDYATLAMKVPGIRLARATHKDSPFEVRVYAMAAGDNPVPSGEWISELSAGWGLLGAVGRYLEARKIPPTKLVVEGPTVVRPYLRAEVYALPNMLVQDTRVTVEAALLKVFRDSATEFNATVPLSRVIQAIENARGVNWVNVSEFHRFPVARFLRGRKAAFDDATVEIAAPRRTTKAADYRIEWTTGTTYKLVSNLDGNILDITRESDTFVAGTTYDVIVYPDALTPDVAPRSYQFKLRVQVGATKPQRGDVWTFGVDHFLGNIAASQYEVILPTVQEGDRLSPTEFQITYSGGIGG